MNWSLMNCGHSLGLPIPQDPNRESGRIGGRVTRVPYPVPVNFNKEEKWNVEVSNCPGVVGLCLWTGDRCNGAIFE